MDEKRKKTENMSIDQLLATTDSLYQAKLPDDFVNQRYAEPPRELSSMSSLSTSISERLGPEGGRLYIQVDNNNSNEVGLSCRVRGRNEPFIITENDVNHDSAFLSRLINAASEGVANISGKNRERLFNTVSKLCKGHLSALEDKVLHDYSTALSTSPSGNIDPTQKDNIDRKLKLMRFSGFSPLKWAAEPDKFQEKLAFLETNKDQILRYMLQQLKTLETSYEHDRTKGEHGVFWKNFSKKDTREGQLRGLNSITQDVSKNLELEGEAKTLKNKDSFEKIIDALAKVKTDIAAEDNIWKSELERKIDGILTDCFDKNKLATINESENTKRLQT